jgi:hypothetical protein
LTLPPNTVRAAAFALTAIIGAQFLAAFLFAALRAGRLGASRLDSAAARSLDLLLGHLRRRRFAHKADIAAKIAANTVIIRISASPVRSTDPDKRDSFGRDCRRDRHGGALVANEAQPTPFFGESRPEPRAKMGANCLETGQKPAGSHTAAEFFQTLFKYGTLQLPFRRGSPARGTS